MKLVVFDLDQTLVDVIALHDEATDRLFQRRFGVHARLTEIDFGGRSQLDNLIMLVRKKGIKVSEAEAPAFSRQLLGEYEQQFGKILPKDASSYIMPGARELLEALSRTDNVVALYTGGSRGIGEPVLAATGLDKYFKFCLYGTEFKSRADMLGEAAARAQKLTRKSFAGKSTVVIGDSIRDVDAGREAGAVTIAVATGFHSKDELQGHHPDFLFDSLRDYKKVLAAIGESPAQ